MKFNVGEWVVVKKYPFIRGKLGKIIFYDVRENGKGFLIVFLIESNSKELINGVLAKKWVRKIPKNSRLWKKIITEEI